MRELAAVILAAGQGTRMRSLLPKVLHTLAGESLIGHVLHTVEQVEVSQTVVVIGHEAQKVREALAHKQVEFVHQTQQLGTGHALAVTEETLAGFQGTILLLYGDVPLLSAQTIGRLLTEHWKSGAQATILTSIIENPTGYGRILRQGENVVGIVEEKDARDWERGIREINTGVYALESEPLWPAIKKLRPENAQGEYYLTDLVKILVEAGGKVGGLPAPDPVEIQGVNDRAQLAQMEKVLRDRVNSRWLQEGVTMVDPQQTYIGPWVELGTDVLLHPGVILHGKTKIGDGVEIGPGCRIIDSSIGDGSQIQYSQILESEVGPECTIGPYAYLRPGTRLGRGVRVGDFVELKKVEIGDGAKIPHLSYVGDAQVGKDVNIGAGSITCNFDGEVKSQTVIEDRAFIGSNSNLVAPVRIGEGAFIAAGSTITEDVPAEALGIARERQVNKEGWTRRRK